MPGVLSKEAILDAILGKEWSFPYNCYEVGHTWTPNCTEAALEISLTASTKVLPLYTLLYAFSQVAVQRRFDLETTWETSKSIIRSSSFIFFNAYNGQLIGCALRNGLGRWYYRPIVFIPGLVSCYAALLLEKPARRQALSFYMLNLASEIVFRMLVDKGYFRPIKHGETLLFCISLAAWYQLIKESGFGRDPVSLVFKLLIGRSEGKSFRSAVKQEEEEDNHTISEIQSDQNPSKRIPFEFLFTKHKTCPHPEATCSRYVLWPTPSRFLIGYGIQSVLKLASNPFKLIANPLQTISDSFISKQSLRFGMFLATLTSLGRLSNCIIRHRCNSNDVPWQGYVSGFVAGTSMLWAPRSSISMYIMWKAVEQYFLRATDNGKTFGYTNAVLMIYAASASTILYAFALEPRFVRPSYMKFLDNLSDHRLHQLNRMVLDVFGTGSSVGYEDFFPDLDPKYMSNSFKELIFDWMIQPY